MKKILLYTVLSLLGMNMSFAQSAKRYPLFEHFTQASCGPCAQQNPAFQNNILAKNQGKIHHMAYHTSWPGVDPMNAENMPGVQTRVTNYNITGVPNIHMMGNGYSGSPANVTQIMTDKDIALGSPLKINVTHSITDTTGTVRINLQSVNNIPTANYVVHVAVVERTVVYATPPGNNGEKVFPNVFRRFLSAPSGDAYAPAAKGDSIILNYTYTTRSNWKKDSLYVIAFVQNTGTQGILNSGASTDPASQITNAEVAINGVSAVKGLSGAASTLNIDVFNRGNANENFEVTLIKKEPATWTSSFSLNSNTYTDSTSILLNANSTNAVTINVTPGSNPGIATYTLKVRSLDNLLTTTMEKTVYVISGVTDLILVSNAARGDKPGTAWDWNQVYIDALNNAGSTTFTSGDVDAFNQIAINNALNGVQHIYFNAGWTYPLFSDALVNNLKSFMDQGGNLFIAGQDVGWEAMDAQSTTSTANIKSFYTNYLKTKYNADGSSSNNMLYTNTADILFGNTSNASISAYYGASYFFPDELSPLTNASSIFYYNTAKTKIGGIRAYDPTAKYKVVYIAPGMEMLNAASSKAIMLVTYNWFHGLISSVTADKEFSSISFYPNPVNDIIHVSNPEGKKLNVSIVNLMGQVMKSISIQHSSESISIAELPAGTYMLQMENSGNKEFQRIVKY